MRWRHRFLALAFMAAACSIYSQDSGGGRTALYTAETADYRQVLLRRTLAGLEGRTLDVRLYPNLDADPEKYVKVSVPVAGSALQLSVIKRAYSAVSRLSSVYFQASDQADPAVIDALHDWVFLAQYTDNPFYPQWLSGEGEKPYNPYWTFLDADGKPMAGATVEIGIARYGGTPEFPDIQIKTATLDEGGRMRRLYCGFGRYIFTVQHPRYGSAAISYIGNSNEPLSTYVVPLVPKDSPSAAQSIHGTVVDMDGRPVKGALIRMRQWESPGVMPGVRSGTANLRFMIGAITDEKGQFAFCEPVLSEDLASARPAPPGRRYILTIQPPKSLNLHQLGMQKPLLVQATDQSTYTLTSMNADSALHTFAFGYPDREIADPDELGDIQLTLLRDGREWIRLAYADFREGFTLPQGILRAEMIRTDGRITFPDIEITAHTPGQISFQLPAPVSYRGKVLDGTTGKPMPGVYVMPGDAFTGNPGSWEAQQWLALQNRAEGYAKSDSMSRPFLDLFSHILLTDAEGFFQASLAPGNSVAISRFTALAPGYARASSKVPAKAAEAAGAAPADRSPRTDANRIVEVPAIKMTPLERVYFPQFVFEDEIGPVTDPGKLSAVRLTIKADIGLTITPLNQFLQRREFSPGIYSADARWGDKLYTLGPVDLKTSRPETVVFKPREMRSARVIYQGQVVHGISGRPIWGAVVFHSVLEKKADVSSLQAGQWDAVKSLGPNPDPDDPAFAPLRQLFSFALAALDKPVFAVTDREGRFRIAVEFANPVTPTSRLEVVAKDFLGIQQQLLMPTASAEVEFSERFKPDKNGVARVPVLKMPPAATVRIHAVVPDTGVYDGIEELKVLWTIAPEDAGSWFPHMQPYATIKGNGVILPNHSYLRTSIDQTAYVPAGVRLTLQVTPSLPKDAMLPILVGSIKLKPGEMKELGRVEMAAPVEIVVKVLDGDGKAVGGVTILCLDAKHESSGTTDSNGTVRLHAAPHSSGRIAFRTVDLPTGQQVEKSISYRVGGPEDAGKVFILQIPEDFLKIYRTVKSPPIRRSVGVQGK